MSYMKTECILNLMNEKEYIKIFDTGLDSMPMMHRVEVCRGEKFAKKLYNAIEKDDNYLIVKANTRCIEFEFCKKEDVEKWLTEFEEREVSEREWQTNRLENKIIYFAYEKGYEIKKNDSMGRWIKIINLKLHEESLKRVEKENQKALDLLEQLL